MTKLQEAAADKTGAKLVAVETNPIDAAWEDRPAAPLASVHPQPLDVAGEAHGDKRKRIGERCEG
jgi:Xaa-Pro aminopeptidase